MTFTKSANHISAIVHVTPLPVPDLEDLGDPIMQGADIERAAASDPWLQSQLAQLSILDDRLAGGDLSCFEEHEEMFKGILRHLSPAHPWALKYLEFLERKSK